MFIQSCTLGCSNGLGGQQVSCQILNTFENADLSIAFSQPVNIATANSSTFRIVNINNGQTPNGTYVLDPNDPRRLIFRPQLIFDIDGSPMLGFEEGGTYQVLIPGQSQGDLPPFIQGTNGRNNQSRLVCQVTTNGIADTVPGRPTFEVFVQDAGGLMVSADNAIDVPGDSPIVVVFNDLMTLGSLLVPTNPFAPSPSISFRIDPDGNLADPSDQVTIAGQLSFQVDFDTLTTSVTFVPSGGLPSGGTGLPRRQVIVDVSTAAIDLADNPVQTQVPTMFAPELILFPATTIDEAFTNVANLQVDESGANMWAQGGMFGNMVVPGVGGGPGRLGTLTVGAGETRTLFTSPTAASGTITFFANPCDQETIQIDGVVYTFADNPVAMDPSSVPISPNSASAAADASVLTASAFADALTANSPSGLSFEVQASDSTTGGIVEILVRATTPGSAGNAIELGGSGGSSFSDTSNCAALSPSALGTSGLFLSGGSDGEFFTAGSLIDNTDFSMGGMPSGITVTDGVFEFSNVLVSATGRLVIRGDNPARIFSRGRFTTGPFSIVDLSGTGARLQPGELADGQLGGEGGPNGGRGGAGGDRPDSSMSLSLIGFNPNPGGISNVGANINGKPGVGVGLMAPAGAMATGAAGTGGSGWPDVMPSETTMHGNLDAAAGFCQSYMVPGPGSGGGYATDGQGGTPLLPIVFGSVETQGEQGILNAPDLNPVDGTPDVTPGGDATSLNIEAPGAPLAVRGLDPDMGFLRGGAGGGGAGANAYGTQILSFGACVSGGITDFATSSGAGGGGAGGAAQMQAGETLSISGLIDASGGSGGDGFVDPLSPDFGRFQSAPGGGGSGGAVLVQGNIVTLAPGGTRISVDGGAGGAGFQGGLGGSGGAGLVRVEDLAGGISAASVAAVVLPSSDPVDPVMFPNSESILSVGSGAFAPDPSSVPGAFSGVQSCFLTPSVLGNFFGLTFEADNMGAGTFGWSLDLVVDVTGTQTLVSFRDPANNGGFPQLMGMSWQEFLGEEIRDGVVASPSPFVVRFQGAKSAQQISDFCDITFGSEAIGLTPWVRHPEELNTFSPRPDMIRFAIIFDESHPLAGQIVGARNLSISAIPD